MHEPTKELAALKYALTKETRLVLKSPYHGGNWQQGWPIPEYKKMKDYYDGTKNERVEFNELKRAQGEDINSWQTRCRDCCQ